VRVEDLTPSPRAWRVGALPSANRPVLENQVRGHEVAPALDEPRDERVRDAERRVRDDVKVATGETQVGSVGLHNHHVGAELRSQLRGSPRMELDGDDAGTELDERPRERA
jgi:hypothetical protein